MKFTETRLQGAFVVEPQPFKDERGYFARAFCVREFEEHGLNPVVAQCNVSYNHYKGTLRGMHYQIPPAAETKFIRCLRGAIYDVIVDMRPDSPTYLQYFGIELMAENGTALYVPGMFAHGYLALTDDTEVLYQVGEFYTPDCERGLRYDDPAIGIEWPIAVTSISDKDKAWPLLDTSRISVGGPSD
jgi:dTDP-4-dehydrorhamnose 3,5-epimerase